MVLGRFKRDLWPSDPEECCTRDGANRIKELIEAYWRERGGLVRVFVVDKPFCPEMRHARYDIRSDMLNGKPRYRALPSQD